jgi:hypothetical protein
VSHVRTQIRNAIKAALTGLTTTGPRVFTSRPEAMPLQTSQLPALLIFPGGEQPETQETLSLEIPAVVSRTMQVVVSARAMLTVSLDDELDTILGEVETVLGAATDLGEKIQWIGAPQIDTGIDATGEQPIGFASMTYELQYFTMSNAPGTAL